MQKMIKTLRRHACLMSLCLLAPVVYGQSNLTLYNMKTIPQRIHTNPARMSDAKNFLGLPAISSQYFGFGNNALSINSVLGVMEPNGSDSFTMNVNKIGDIFSKSNFISVEQSFDILSFGFRIKKKSYFYVTSTLSQNLRITYPGDLFDLITDGNGGKNINRTFDLAFGLDFLQYVDFGVGFSRKFMDEKLIIGARYRYLKGLNIINTERNLLTFKTNPDTYDLTVTSDIKINASSSLAPIDSLEAILNQTEISINDVLNSNNTGYALDFGIDYKMSKRINLSASVKNLGKINWNTNTFNIVSENPGASYTYRGIEIKDVFNEDGSGFEESGQKLADTLKERFNLIETRTTFATGIFAEFYIGGNFNFSRDHNAGLLVYGNFYQSQLNPALTLSLNSKLTNLLAFSASYTLMPGSYANAGLGVTLNGGPFQIYVVSDNVGGLLKPNDVKNLNIRAGFNLAMQRKDLEAKAEREAEKAKRKAEKKAS